MGSRSIFVDLSQNEKVPEVPQDAIESVRFEWLLRTPNYPNGSGSVGQTNVHIGTLDNEQRIHVEGKDIKAVFDTLNLFNVGQKPENWVSESARVSVRETLPEFCCKYHQKKFYEEEF
ncbi:MAG: hypothetical protein HYT64_02210 [Candidatus Yanofskybacteria bacterium]|nr:hypothetical protein [Candidatus Yanofskybacteria bacterium]